MDWTVDSIVPFILWLSGGPNPNPPISMVKLIEAIRCIRSKQSVYLINLQGSLHEPLKNFHLHI